MVGLGPQSKNHQQCRIKKGHDTSADYKVKNLSNQYFIVDWLCFSDVVMKKFSPHDAFNPTPNIGAGNATFNATFSHAGLCNIHQYGTNKTANKCHYPNVQFFPLELLKYE